MFLSHVGVAAKRCCRKPRTQFAVVEFGVVMQAQVVLFT
jgi:hypothetical protein